MRKNRAVKALTAVILCAVLLSGCLNGATNENTSPPPQTEQANNTPQPEQTPQAVQTESTPKPEDAVSEEEGFDLTFVPVKYETKVPAYTVAPDLSNVANIAQFGEFTDKQKQMLAENHFLVLPTTEWQLFYILEHNEYLEIPSFISTDAVLQVYHLLYDYTLRQTEEEFLINRAESLTRNMLNRLAAMYEDASDEKTKTALEYCIAYFYVASQLLEIDAGVVIPEKSAMLVREETELITAASGLGSSPVADSLVLYSNFTVRGHYTRSPELGRYFLAMMWYGTVPYPLFDNDGNVMEDSALKGLLTAYALMSLSTDDGITLWDDIYSPTAFYVGSSDDLTPSEYWSLMLEVYGNDLALNSLSDSAKITEFAEKAKNLRPPRIATKIEETDELEGMNAGAQFRFMGQRYIPDSEILQTLCEPIVRPFPSGLDVMAVLGSDKAEGYIDEYLSETVFTTKEWPGYRKVYEKIKKEFAELPDTIWRSNMYYGWLWTLLPLLQNVGEGYPQFMQKSAWEDKSLATALGSWSELRHDTVLYGKQSAAEMGDGGEEPQFPPGYVEPNIGVYERLKWLTQYSAGNLKQRGLITETTGEKMDNFARMLDFLIGCSIKELNYEALTDEEYNRIISIGGWLEYLSASIATDNKWLKDWYEIESETDRNMALVTDIHNVRDRMTGGMLYLHEGVGTAAEILVITPHPDGNLYLTRGAVFDYYEFIADEKLTDEKWQGMLRDGEAPARGGWIDSYLDGSETDRAIPYPERE